MLNKEKVKECLVDMPGKFSAYELIDPVVLMQKIEIARQQYKNGQFLTEDELDREINSWTS
jgi:hypothetical protein